AADKVTVVFTPTRPLPAGRRFIARFTGGVRDAGGTPYQGAVPYGWSFATSTVVAPGGQVDPTKIRLLVPQNGTAQVVGLAGALPTVLAGSTPWAVVAEVDAPAVCSSLTTNQAGVDGSFSTTSGCAAVPATIASKVYLKVFDPQGNLAAQIKLGP